jgi:hypothetical protein
MPRNKVTNMRMIELDASNWASITDFYSALFDALGVSQNRGRNPNALLDMMVWSPETVALQPPYTLRIVRTGSLPEDVREHIASVQLILRDVGAEAMGVNLEVNP